MLMLMLMLTLTLMLMLMLTPRVSDSTGIAISPRCRTRVVSG